METNNRLSLSEKELIEKILAGDTSLFEILVRQVNSAIYRIARFYGFHHQDAQDLMQETHLTAFLKLSSFGFRASYKTWVSRIMARHCLYRLKHGYVKFEEPGSNRIGEGVRPIYQNQDRQATEAVLATRECVHAIESCLRQIPASYRMVFVLRDMEGYSVSETAFLLDLSLVNVKVRLSRARRLIQKELIKVYGNTDLYPFHLSDCNRLTKNVIMAIGSPTYSPHQPSASLSSASS